MWKADRQMYFQKYAPNPSPVSDYNTWYQSNYVEL